MRENITGKIFYGEYLIGRVYDIDLIEDIKPYGCNYNHITGEGSLKFIEIYNLEKLQPLNCNLKLIIEKEGKHYILSIYFSPLKKEGQYIVKTKDIIKNKRECVNIYFRYSLMED